MSLTNRSSRPGTGGSKARRLGAAALLAAAGGLGGCGFDSYLDPSVVGRWEKTPTIVPILDRIAVIEPASGEAVESSDVTVDDLVPEIEAYRIRSGDFLEVVIFGLFQSDVPERYERQVDQRGFVDLPQIGEVYADGMTREQFRAEIGNRLRELEILSEEPVISVVALRQRERTFNLIGAVQNPGTYGVPYADYRLLEAVAAGGSVNEQAEFIYVIRQVPLTDAAAGRTARPGPSTRPTDPISGDPAGGQDRPSSDGPGDGREAPDDLESIIDDLSAPPPGSPGAFAEQPGGAVVTRREPNDTTRPTAASTETTGRRQPELEPAVDLIDDANPGDAPAGNAAGGTPGGGVDGASWVYINGKWVMVRSNTPARGTPRAGGGERASDPSQPIDLEDSADFSPVVTQRVIKVPLEDLLAGNAKYNIVVRPGDTIRVPPRATGNYFMMGQISRPGAYNLSDQLTLRNAIAAAGGLGGLAVPERVDLTRMIGDDRAATVRLNLRAIAEGTQPDIYIKPNDNINIGTNFWAYPLAVLRNGFRTNYGFGFLLDRNFGNDVFGPPPRDQAF